MKIEVLNMNEFLDALEEQLKNLQAPTNPITKRPDVICLGHDQDPVYIPGNKTVH